MREHKTRSNREFCLFVISSYQGVIIFFIIIIDKVHQQCDFLDSQTFSSEALTENFQQNVCIWKGKQPISLFNS